MNFRTAMVVFFKYRNRAALVFLGFIMLSVAACMVMRTQYSASAMILVKLGRELVYHPDVGTSAAAVPTIDKDENIASAIEIMQSDPMAEQVIQSVGLARMYPDLLATEDASPLARAIHDAMDKAMAAIGMLPEQPITTAVRLFHRKLKIEAIKKTDIIEVRFLHPDPQVAADVANATVRLFESRSGEIYSDPNLAAQQASVDEQRAALQQVQDRLNAYRQAHKVYDLPGQVAALLQQRLAIDTNMKSDEAHLAELLSVVATLRVQRASTPPRLTLFSDTERARAVDDAEAQLLTLRIQEKQMASHFRDDYGPLVTLRNQIALAHSAVGSGKSASAPQVRTGVNDTFQLLDQNTMQREAELKSLYERQSSMRSQIAGIDEALKTLSEHERELQDLEQDVGLRTAGLKTTYDKLMEARAVDGLNHGKSASFSVYQPAIPADLANPARPLPVLYTLIAAVLGIFGAFTTVFLSFWASKTFLTAELASQRLHLPVLAVLDYQRKLARRQPIRYHDGSGVVVAGSHSMPAPG